MCFLRKKHLILVQKIGYGFGGYPRPPVYGIFFGKKGVTDLGGTPPPFTEKIGKVVFEGLPKKTWFSKCREVGERERWFLAANWGQSRPPPTHHYIGQIFSLWRNKYNYLPEPGPVRFPKKFRFVWIWPEKPVDQRAIVTVALSSDDKEGERGNTKGAITRFLFLGIFQLRPRKKDDNDNDDS